MGGSKCRGHQMKLLTVCGPFPTNPYLTAPPHTYSRLPPPPPRAQHAYYIDYIDYRNRRPSLISHTYSHLPLPPPSLCAACLLH